MKNIVPALSDQIAAIWTEAIGLAAHPYTSDGSSSDWNLIADLVANRVIARGERRIAISGSQGTGKTTLAQVVVDAIQTLGHSAQAISIDDYYLTQQDRVKLAASVHPLLRTRGVPGTHDIQWLRRTIDAHARREPLTLPRFDKGVDDRAGQKTVECEFLVLEGWCVGVPPQNSETR